MTATKVPTATVYLIAQPSISRRKEPPNLKPLYEHGEVKVVHMTGDSPSRNGLKCYELLEERLSSFDPETDFLVWAGGDTLSAVMVGMYLAHNEIWQFNWLQYERRRLPDGTRTDDGAKYVPTVIDLSVPDEEE